MDTRLETPRLVLRPWAETDIDQLVLGLNDLDLAKWMAFVPHPYSRSDAVNWVDQCSKLAKSGSRPTAHEFAIALKSTDIAIGGVSLNKIDRTAGTAGGGIWIARQYQGQGYGAEAFAAKIRYAFRELGLKKLVNGYFEGNERSWAMQRRLGYQPAGQVPARCLADGRQTIEHVTTLLREDWQDRARGVLSRA